MKREANIRLMQRKYETKPNSTVLGLIVQLKLFSVLVAVVLRIHCSFKSQLISILRTDSVMLKNELLCKIVKF